MDMDIAFRGEDRIVIREVFFDFMEKRDFFEIKKTW